MSHGEDDDNEVYAVKERLHDAFLLTETKDRIMSTLRAKTMMTSTWHTDTRDKFIEYIKAKGPDNVNVAKMIKELGPARKESFPEDVKKQMAALLYEEAKKYFVLEDEKSEPGKIDEVSKVDLPPTEVTAAFDAITSNPEDLPPSPPVSMETFCMCEDISYGKMVQCDNSGCLKQWFHFECVKIKRAPKGNWFCPNCRGKTSSVKKD